METARWKSSAMGESNTIEQYGQVAGVTHTGTAFLAGAAVVVGGRGTVFGSRGT